LNTLPSVYELREQYLKLRNKLLRQIHILMSEATLDELRELAQDLRTLAPDSALAELVEVKIEQVLAEGGQD
jgi:hypothetical protein